MVRRPNLLDPDSNIGAEAETRRLCHPSPFVHRRGRADSSVGRFRKALQQNRSVAERPTKCVQRSHAVLQAAPAGIRCRIAAGLPRPLRRRQAERLLWRAGFGPRPGRGDGARRARPARRGPLADAAARAARSSGRRRACETGKPIAPYDVWGNDVLWWLDRMVRSQAPLIERMTLTWHDWFATSNEGVNSQRLMINQNRTPAPALPRELPADARRR